MAGSLALGVNLSGAEFGSRVPGTFGVDYTYPTHSEIDYYAGKGLGVIRLPFLWERIQRSEFGALDATELGRLDDVVSYATGKGLKVDIDPHNYGYGFGNLIGSAQTPNSAFADLWGKLAAHFKSNSNVIFGLMNEPHDQSASAWLGSANAAIAAIRNAGAAQEILVPGSYWDGAWTWVSSDNDTVVGAGVADPAHNFAFEVHQYLDSDGSGNSGAISTTVGVERLTAITQWAEQTGNRLFLGEVGVTSDQTNLTALDAMLGYMQQHTGAWQGMTFWSGGPWWGNYQFSIEPQNGVDKPQMGILLQHLSAPPPAPGPIGPVALVGSGDFNGNGNGEFVWRGSNASMSAWEYDAAAQTITATNLGAVDPGWASFASGHFINGASASASQMLMDYVPNGTMTLWWVSSAGQLSGIDLGQRWNNIGMIAAGQFATLGGNGISNFLVSNLTDHHLYNWWIGSNNQLQGIDLGSHWTNVSLVTTGQFTNNGGTNLLVSNDVDHHLYDWWIGSNGTLQGIDLGAHWSNVALVGNGQFTANGGTNLLVTNTVDHHLYDWWISNGTLQGIDLGAAWSNIQLVTVGHFDNKTSNTQMLVTNTLDHHLYEWWISPQGQLAGIDLGPAWSNVQFLGTGHYNNNSAFDELLVRNTADGHFYEWWIANNRLVGVDLGVAASATAAASSNSMTTAGATSSSAELEPSSAANTGTAGGSNVSGLGGGMSMAGLSTTASVMAPDLMGSDVMGSGLAAKSADPTASLVQAIASFGATDDFVNVSDPLADTGHLQPSQIAVLADSSFARGGGT
jgi:endoglucanase